MKVHVDASKCQAYGTCSEIAPQVFELDEWGYARVVGEGSVDDHDREAVLQAVKECPALAIVVDES